MRGDVVDEMRWSVARSQGLDFNVSVTDGMRDIGYNMRSLIDYSVVIGWHLIDWTTLRIEYTRRSIDLVDGTPAGIHALSSDLNHFGIELGVHF